MIGAAEKRLIDREPRVTGLRLLLDPDALREALVNTEVLGTMERIGIDYLRYKPGENCLARIRSEVEGRPLWGYAKAYGKNADSKLNKSSGRTDHGSELGPGRLQLPDWRMEVNFLPNDNALPSIGRLGDPASRDALLQRIFKGGEDWRGSAFSVLNYKPERRLAARFSHPDGRVSVVKFSTPGRYEQSRRFHKKLATVEGVLLPEMVGGSKAHCALAFEWKEGVTPGAELRAGHYRACAPVGAALARFHRSKQPGLEPLDHDRARHRVIELAAGLQDLAPELSQRASMLAGHLADWLEANPVAAPMPAHGDFYPEQAVATGGGVALIDCDHACLAHPLLDLGTYVARLEFDALSGVLSHDFAEQSTKAFLAGYRAQAAVSELAGLERFTAYGLFRLVHHPFRQRLSDWPRVTEEVLERAAELWRIDGQGQE